MKVVFWIIFSMLKLQYAMIASTLIDFSFLYSTLTIIGGILGVYIFTQLGRDFEKLIIVKFPKRFKKFSRKNRFLAKLRRKWGIWGISFLTPILLGIPLGVFISLTITTNKWSVIKPMSISIIFWISLFSSISLLF